MIGGQPSTSSNVSIVCGDQQWDHISMRSQGGAGQWLLPLLLLQCKEVTPTTGAT